MQLVHLQRRFSSGVNWRGRARFYSDVDVKLDEATQKFLVLLDGRVLKTPGMQPFALPTKSLACVVAQEWDSQVCVLETSLMPVTMQCATAIDITSVQRPNIVTELLRYLTTDVVCFPSEIIPEEMSKESQKLFNTQSLRWKPSVDYFQHHYGKLEVLTSHTLRMPLHPKDTLLSARLKLETLCDFKLNAMHQLAHGCKSLVIPMALADRVISVNDAVVASRAEEDHQIGNWGLVEGSHDVDEVNLRVQISASSLILWLS